MLLGVDFDNTIVCYDQVFHDVALDLGLIEPQVGRSKGQVRDWLRAQGREEDWIELQGLVYGARLGQAPPFPGVLEFLGRCRRQGVELRVISHKTCRPFKGPDYDLHQAALDWLEAQGFFAPQGLGLGRAQVCLELTKQDKLSRIGQEGCTHFIDDLPEFLAEPSFPAATRRLWFNPRGGQPQAPWPQFAAWEQAGALLGLEREQAA